MRPAASVAEPADKLFKRLKAARLDNTIEADMRSLAHIPLLILDDFCLQPFGRHRDRRLLRTDRGTPMLKENRVPFAIDDGARGDAVPNR